MQIPKQTSGGQRWSAEQDARLLQLANDQQLAHEQQNWRVIATVLNRSYFSVLNRFRFLQRCSNAPAKPTERSRSLPPEKEPDLSCGAQSQTARRVVQQLWTHVQRTDIYQSGNGPTKLRNEIGSILGALARETFLSHVRKCGPITVTISRVSAKRDGIAREYFRTIISALEEAGFLERFVGYPDKLRLEARDARKSRAVMIRASCDLIQMFETHGIDETNLWTHFPPLG